MFFEKLQKNQNLVTPKHTLSGSHRSLAATSEKMLKVRLQKLKECTEDEQGMLDAYNTPVDFRNKENIRPLVEYVLK